MSHRLAVLCGVQSVHGALEESVIDALVAKLAKMGVNEGYAFVSGRNAAVSKMRKDAIAQKRRLTAERKAEKARLWEEKRARLHAEVMRLALGIRNPRYQAGVLSMVDSTGVQGLMERCGISRNVVYQWRRRGILEIMPHASEELRAELSRRHRGIFF